MPSGCFRNGHVKSGCLVPQISLGFRGVGLLIYDLGSHPKSLNGPAGKRSCNTSRRIASRPAGRWLRARS